MMKQFSPTELNFMDLLLENSRISPSSGATQCILLFTFYDVGRELTCIVTLYWSSLSIAVLFSFNVVVTALILLP